MAMSVWNKTRTCGFLHLTFMSQLPNFLSSNTTASDNMIISRLFVSGLEKCQIKTNSLATLDFATIVEE